MAGRQETIIIKNPPQEILDILEDMQEEKEKRHKEFLDELKDNK